MRGNEGGTMALVGVEHEDDDDAGTAEETQQQESRTEVKVGSADVDPADQLAELQKRSSRERELVEVIHKKEMEMIHQEAAIKVAQGTLKKLTGERDKLNHELHEVVMGRGQQELPFPNHAAEAPPNAEPTPADDDAWRSVPLADIGLDPKIVEKLAAKDYGTMGALADYTARGGLLIDIDGIGEATAEKIQNATDTYWANHPRQQAKPKGTTPGEIKSPADLGLSLADITGIASEDLIERLTAGGDVKVAVLQVKIGDVTFPHINVGNLDPDSGEVSTPAGKPTNRLVPVYPQKEFNAKFPEAPAASDHLFGCNVKDGRKTYVIGPVTESILVDVSE